MMAARLDLADLSLVQAADAVRKGEVSAVALLEACLANLDAHEDAVNATIWVTRSRTATISLCPRKRAVADSGAATVIGS